MSILGDDIQDGTFPESVENARSRGRPLSLVVLLLLVTLILPFIFYLGPLRLSVYRIVLIAVFIPVTLAWLSGRAGRIRLADISLLLLCSWGAISFVVVHGVEGLQAGGMLFFETIGPFLIARVYVRSAQAFRAMAKALFLIVICLLPFAVVEAVSGRNVLLEIMNAIWQSYPRVAKDPRWGLQRVQATFEHPILFGVFCSSAIALTYLVVGMNWSLLKRGTATMLVLFTAALSLSAGPMTGMTTQLLLIAWDKVFNSIRARWKILAGLVAVLWVFLEIASNRSPAQIFVQYFSFNEFSAYMRLHIWNFGTASILDHPVFGIGFNEWKRPYWMSPSIDMFWIVPGVRHGLPAILFNFVAFFAVFIPLIFRNGLNNVQSICRMGILFCLLALFLTGWTVHYWNATYVLFYFLLGSGMWLLEAGPSTAEEKPLPEAKKPRPSYRRKHVLEHSHTRFGNKTIMSARR